MSEKQPSEPFGNVRNQENTLSEDFGNSTSVSEKTAEHILTVREVAKQFENAGVPRTERSIINWCHENKQGLTRLDCYLDPNEKKYFITPNSVNQVIGEEKNKQLKQGQNANAETFRTPSENHPSDSEDFGSKPNPFQRVPNPAEHQDEAVLQEKIKELQNEKRNLEITNKVKDTYIEQLQKNHEGFIEALNDKSYRIGQLETELRLLQAPNVIHNIKEETQTEGAEEETAEEETAFEAVESENSHTDSSEQSQRTHQPEQPKRIVESEDVVETTEDTDKNDETKKSWFGGN